MYDRVAQEITRSWREIARTGNLELHVAGPAGPISPHASIPASAPRLRNHVWEMVFPARFPYRVTSDQVLRIHLPFLEPSSEEEVFLLAGPVTAMAMWSCRLFPLHATAFHFQRSAVAVCAPSGVGKSTLASLAIESGLPVQGDDLLGLAPEGDLIPLPGSLRIAPAHRRDAEPLFRMKDGRGWFSLASGERKPLGSLVCLRRGSGPVLSAVKGTQRLSLLLSAGFLSRYDPSPPEGWHAVLLELCARIPVWELEVPEGLDELKKAWPEIRRLLEFAQA